MSYLKGLEIKKRTAPYREKPKRNTKERRELNENDKKFVAKQAKAFFHRWVKWRDRGLPCCACGESMSHLPEHMRQASHYRPSKNNSAIRYHPDNVHLGCSYCNEHLAGNESNYRIRLVQKIGLERVEWLESQRQVKKWSIEELREIRDKYKALLIENGVPLPRNYN